MAWLLETMREGDPALLTRGGGIIPYHQNRSLLLLSTILQPSSTGELIERDGNTNYTLAVLYIVSAFYAARRFAVLWGGVGATPLPLPSTTHTAAGGGGFGRSRGVGALTNTEDVTSLSASSRGAAASGSRWDVGKLFVGSVFFACLVRALSFTTIAVLAFQNVEVDSNDGGRTQEQEFYHRVLAILFNVGDWAAISTYLLLVVSSAATEEEEEEEAEEGEEDDDDDSQLRPRLRLNILPFTHL
jgi:hypothetical protein